MVNVDPPYDMVLATDCIYHENHMEYLLDTVLQITNHRSSSIDAFHRIHFGVSFVSQ